ncbi:HAD-IA family hydrolase [Devosia sp. FKR38]|uniref:HAD-IA family hydrolase n=1 Tax=Devosia sp. FKR38 TaxID=2562312 RepID=UPI0010C07D2C|nr:HAD-IA family hydrolase [Devosia sp. FKR38]
MRTIMLDVDGVLVRGRPHDGAHLFTDLEKDLGLSLDQLQSAFFKPRWPAIVTGQKPLVPELTEVLASIAPHVTAEALIDYWFFNDSRVDLAVLDAVGKLRLSGDRVYLATNQEHMRANYLMETMGLKDHVDGIFYSASIGHRKPDRAFFAHATGAVAVPVSDITLIDDTEENVLAARAFGWSAVHWTPDMSVAQELAALTSQQE